MQCSILLIAADPAVHRHLGPILGGAGHAVEEARTGGRAISAVRHRRFDVVLLDYQMPGMNGLALARTIRDLCRAHGRSTALVAIARSGDDFILHGRPGALFAACLCLTDTEKVMLDVAERCAALTGGVMALPDISVSRGRAAAATVWTARGHAGLPIALVLPEPFPHQRETLQLCFEIERPELAECVLLLERHGVGLIPKWAERLPVIAVSADAADVADALFTIEDEDSWEVVAALIADAAPANTAR